MSNHSYPRRLLDDAIDHAVQELVGAEPRPGFRRRVLERLNARPARRTWIPRLLVPATAVAAVLTLAILLRPPSTSAPAPLSLPVAHAPAATAPTVPTEPPPVVASKASAPRIAPRTSPVPFEFGPRTDRVGATSIFDAPAAVSTDKAADEAARARDDVRSSIAPIAIPSITVRPIEIKEIK